MKVLRLDEIEGIPVFGTLVWKPVRRPLGITAFGINAHTAANAGAEARLGEKDAALEHLNAAVAKAERRREYLDSEHFDSIRDDPRFPGSK